MTQDVIQELEPFLSAKQLRPKIQPYLPGASGTSLFPKLLPYFPYTLLPGCKRKVFLFSVIMRWLHQQVTEPPPPEAGESPLHRRRGKRAS